MFAELICRLQAVNLNVWIFCKNQHDHVILDAESSIQVNVSSLSPTDPVKASQFQRMDFSPSNIIPSCFNQSTN